MALLEVSGSPGLGMFLKTALGGWRVGEDAVPLSGRSALVTRYQSFRNEKDTSIV